MASPSSSTLIRKAFDRKKKDFKSFSLRWTASKLEISHAYLAHIVRGLRPIPIHIVEPLCEILDLDAEARSKVYQEAFKAQGYKPLSDRRKNRLQRDKWNMVPLKDFDLISNWETMAILVTTLTNPYDGTPDYIAKHLALPKSLVVHIMDVLLEKGYLVSEKGRLVASADFFEFQTNSSREQLYQYHKSVLNKARETHDTKRSDEDRNARYITSAVVTCSKEDLARLKMKIQDFLTEFVQEASSNRPEEVYQVGLQFFPLTNLPTSKKP